MSAKILGRKFHVLTRERFNTRILNRDQLRLLSVNSRHIASVKSVSVETSFNSISRARVKLILLYIVLTPVIFILPVKVLMHDETLKMSAKRGPRFRFDA